MPSLALPLVFRAAPLSRARRNARGEYSSRRTRLFLCTEMIIFAGVSPIISPVRTETHSTLCIYAGKIISSIILYLFVFLFYSKRETRDYKRRIPPRKLILQLHLSTGVNVYILRNLITLKSLSSKIPFIRKCKGVSSVFP